MYPCVFQLDLVCSRTIFKSHATTAGNVGSLIGFLTLGPTADRLTSIITNQVTRVFHPLSNFQSCEFKYQGVGENGAGSNSIYFSYCLFVTRIMSLLTAFLTLRPIADM